jgi:hypothetical protein
VFAARALPADTGLARRVRERRVARVLEELVRAQIRHVQVHIVVTIVVGGTATVPERGAVGAGFFREVGERAVAVVEQQVVARRGVVGPVPHRRVVGVVALVDEVHVVESVPSKSAMQAPDPRVSGNAGQSFVSLAGWTSPASRCSRPTASMASAYSRPVAPAATKAKRTTRPSPRVQRGASIAPNIHGENARADTSTLTPHPKG